MPEPAPDPELARLLLPYQKNEITEHHIYTRIAAATRDPANRDVLLRIAAEELGHYRIWRRYTGQDPGPDRLRVWSYALAARIFGMTFTLRLMEGVERKAQAGDRSLAARIPELPQMVKNEDAHERELIALLDEERLRYLGSVVLGLNDALIEFTGMLAGLTFAIQNTQIIAVAGLITGVAASLSMGASEYMSQRAEESRTDPFRASFYTGITYIVTVALLILPFLVLASPYTALLLSLGGAVVIIFVFTFYLSVAKDLPFRRRFLEMAAISLGIAAVSFVIGYVIRIFLNVNV